VIGLLCVQMQHRCTKDWPSQQGDAKSVLPYPPFNRDYL